MNDPITLKLNADKYIMMALEEDITSEDISTNSVMPEYQKGEVQLICKQDGIIATSAPDGIGQRLPNASVSFVRASAQLQC